MFQNSLRALIVLASICTEPTAALWQEQHEEGWHWYQDPVEEPKADKKAQSNAALSDPLAEIALEQQSLERLRAEAILRPSEASVKAYIERQVWASNKADRFSQVWDAVLRLHPELDYTVKYPAVQFARHIYLDQQQQKIHQAIDTFKQTYGFLFFFRADCLYSEALAPIIQELSIKHGISLQAVSLDNGTLKEYPHPLPDNGISQKMNVYSVPAVFAVNPSRDEWFPIVTGAISSHDLEERILSIAEYLDFDEQENQHADHP